MEKTHNLKHSKETLYYSLARMVERASFYGFQALMVLYMMDETHKMEGTEAVSVFNWYTASLLISQIVGAIFGDLIIGNKNQ